jgi:hypothetical protein
MRTHFKARFPEFNVMHRNEAIATDTVYSDTPVVIDGARCVQLFVGRETLVTDIYGMKSGNGFITTLKDNICKRGAMDKLISNRALTEINNKIQEILRAYLIKYWQSKPYHQNQNYAERHYALIKSCTSIVLNQTGAPPNTWLLCLQYVCYVFNHISVSSLQCKTPMQIHTGETSDISIIMHFEFYEEVFFFVYLPHSLQCLQKHTCVLCCFGELVGDAMTFKVVTRVIPTESCIDLMYILL